MCKLQPINRPNLDVSFDLIYHSEFKMKEKNPLNYLQFVKCVKLSKEGVDNHPNDSNFDRYIWIYQNYLALMNNSKDLYDEFKSQIGIKLFSFFQSASPIKPQVIVVPPTSNKDFHKSLIEPFQKIFKVIDLSEYLEINPGGRGTIKYRKINNTAILPDIKRFLIIDDVYATGETMDSIIFHLGSKKSFSVLCPLFVKQNV